MDNRSVVSCVTLTPDRTRPLLATQKSLWYYVDAAIKRSPVLKAMILSCMTLDFEEALMK